MKLATNSPHVSGSCWEGFQGQKSKIKITARPRVLFMPSTYGRLSVVCAAEAYRSTVWRRGSLVLFCQQ